MVKEKKTVLLTGASRGIGKSIYETLSASGDYTILAPRREEMDLSSADSIKAYMKKASQVDILINDAGINILKAIEDIDEDSFAQMMEVNLQAPVKLIQSVVPHMKRQKYGRIVNISSIWGVRSKELRTLYSITKFALNGVTHALARELGEYNILVNSVCPGFTDTELTRKNIPAAERAQIEKEIPLGRFAQPQEIAGLVKFLVSSENTYLTGQTLIVDGGFLT